jgi:CRISPR-associated endonuclease Cas1
VPPEDVADLTAARAATFARDTSAAGVCVADGHVRIFTRRGALVIQDGAGEFVRERMFDRATHGLSRLVALSPEAGYLSFEALTWLRRVGLPVVVLAPDGSPTFASTPRMTDDARLRRAQALAPERPIGVEIARYLLRVKLEGQAAIARDLDRTPEADTIESLAAELEVATTIEDARNAERLAAQLYWSVWAKAAPLIGFVSKDARRVPAHWSRFDGRRSMLRRGESNQRAERPVNALLGYVFRLGEVEAHLACAALALDSGLGIVHSDYPGRASLALDLLEAIRPDIERYVLELVERHAFRKCDFVELADGHVRLTAPLTHTLAETLPTWARLVAPHAEHVAHLLTDTINGRTVKRTPLTSTRRREAVRRTGAPRKTAAAAAPLPAPTCHGCGASLLRSGSRWCAACLPEVKQNAAKKASKASADARRARAARGASDQSAESRCRIGAAIGRRDEEAKAWDAAHPGLVVDPADFDPLRAALAALPVIRIAAAVGLSKGYVAAVRRGDYTPHPRHWGLFAEIAGVACPFDDQGDAAAPDLTWWREVVVPALGAVPTTEIMAATGMSSSAASKVRRGLHVPSPKLWSVLADLAHISSDR